MKYSLEPRHQIFLNGYELFSFAKDKNISKYLSSKYSQKLVNYTNNLLQWYLKLLQN